MKTLPTAEEKRALLIQYINEISTELSDCQIGELHKVALILRQNHHLRKERYIDDAVELTFKKKKSPVQDGEINNEREDD